MVNLGHGGRAADISHGLPIQGRPTELPSGRMPRPSGDEDISAGPFPTPACPGHRGRSVGRKPPPHPRCPRCDMLVPRKALNVRHLSTSQCVRGAEQKRRRLAEAELRESLERAFESYGEPLQNVMAFKYLGQVLAAVDDD